MNVRQWQQHQGWPRSTMTGEPRLWLWKIAIWWLKWEEGGGLGSGCVADTILEGMVFVAAWGGFSWRW